jgi:recombination protein RecR
MAFPKSLQHLIDTFRKSLPGVGPKTAERFAISLAKDRTGKAANIARAIAEMKKALRACGTCFTLSDLDPCTICADTKRDAQLLCVVADPQDILALERTGVYTGRYHVLGGLLSPISGVSADQLTIQRLLERIGSEKIIEVILALDATMDGEATALHIKQRCQSLTVTVSRLARGLPMGSDIEYADEITLTDALTGRRILT